MSVAERVNGVPYWTERMYRPGGGQDHLGLGSVVTDRILPRLSPAINVLTVHPRYWSGRLINQVYYQGRYWDKIYLALHHAHWEEIRATVMRRVLPLAAKKQVGIEVVE